MIGDSRLTILNICLITCQDELGDSVGRSDSDEMDGSYMSVYLNLYSFSEPS